ncbi:MAG TPA: hypothetical protein VLI07_13870 [Candidatus Binatus sp.]|nr:hypothetical protein [Candidatus Binatus sp.]
MAASKLAAVVVGLLHVWSLGMAAWRKDWRKGFSFALALLQNPDF